MHDKVAADRKITDSFFNSGQEGLSTLTEALKNGTLDPNLYLTDWSTGEGKDRQPLIEYAIGLMMPHHLKAFIDHGFDLGLFSEKYISKNTYQPKAPVLWFLFIAGLDKPEAERLDFFKVLLDFGFDPFLGFPDYNTVTELVRREDTGGHYASLFSLLEHLSQETDFSRFDQPDRNGHTPLGMAIDKWKLDMIQFLVDQGFSCMPDGQLLTTRLALSITKEWQSSWIPGPKDIGKLDRLIRTLIDQGVDLDERTQKEPSFLDQMKKLVRKVPPQHLNGLSDLYALAESSCLQAHLAPGLTPASARVRL
jgi:ankyrin repeat protein